MHDHLARKVGWQLTQTFAQARPAAPSAALDTGGGGFVVGCAVTTLRDWCGLSLARFAQQGHLRGVIELLAGAAILHAPQVAQLDLELVDEQQGILERQITLSQLLGKLMAVKIGRGAAHA